MGIPTLSVHIVLHFDTRLEKTMLWLNILEIALYCVILAGLILSTPFLVRRLASADIFFTFPTTNQIKYVERGGKKDDKGNWSGGVLDHYLPEVPGFRLEGENLQNQHFVEDPSVQGAELGFVNSLFHRWFGVYWYGLYPFFHIRTFQIKKEYENLQGTDRDNWIRHGDIVTVDALRFAFPRPYVFTEIELKDRSSVDIKIVLEFEVVRPYTPVYVYHGDFFTQAGSLLQGAVIDLLKDHELQEFLELRKGEENGILADLKKIDGAFNAKLIELVGLRILSLSINDWRASDEDILKAMRKKLIAQKDQEADVVRAETYERTVEIQTRADVARLKALAGGRGEYILQTKAALALPDADPTAVAQAAAAILEMEAATSETSKLTTLVKDSSKAVIPVGGNKK